MYRGKRRLIDYIEGLGILIIAISVLWLMGIAGADDLGTTEHVFGSLLPLVGKTAAGLLGMGLGVILVNVKEVGHEKR